MGYGKSSLLCIVLALSLCSTMALDITAVLSKNPDYAEFSKSLTETKLAEEINGLNAVTVLVLDNAAMAPLAGKPLDVVKSILSNHVLTKYYDMRGLSDAQGSVSPMETIAKKNIFVSLINEGEFAFGTAAEAPGVVLDCLMVRTAENQPQTLSVFQVTKAINAAPASIGGVGASKVMSVPSAEGIAAAPAPAPASGSSRVTLGFFAVVSALASLLVLS